MPCRLHDGTPAPWPTIGGEPPRRVAARLERMATGGGGWAAVDAHDGPAGRRVYVVAVGDRARALEALLGELDGDACPVRPPGDTRAAAAAVTPPPTVDEVRAARSPVVQLGHDVAAQAADLSDLSDRLALLEERVAALEDAQP